VKLLVCIGRREDIPLTDTATSTNRSNLQSPAKGFDSSHHTKTVLGIIVPTSHLFSFKRVVVMHSKGHMAHKFLHPFHRFSHFAYERSAKFWWVQVIENGDRPAKQTCDWKMKSNRGSCKYSHL
jgi:hypothetical protein